MRAEDTRPGRMLARFEKLFGGRPQGWARAPGRAELLGTDTDDHEGYVLTMSIQLDTWIAFRPSKSTTCRVHTLDVGANGETTEWHLGQEPSQPAGTWDRYVNGVASILLAHGHQLSGIDAVVHSTVPIGGGLSSSAALEVATALMFQAAGGFTLEPRRMAQICQQAENQCVGVKCGVLDQYSSLFGRQDTALLLDCRSLTHIELRIPSDLRVVICDTHFPRTLAGSEYATRRQECDEGTHLLRRQDPKIQTLRDVSPPMFDRMQASLPELLARRCRFVIEENRRVMEFAAALVRDDRECMRRICAESFAGMRDLYGKTVPAMERMIEAIDGAPGTVAGRQTGGGLGGCMIAFVLADQIEAFTAHVQGSYKDATGILPTIFVAMASPGAGPLDP